MEKSVAPLIKQSAQFTFGSWSVPQLPLTIEYPLEVMDEIRAAVCEGLQQLAHGGLEVGGVLFGAKRDNLVRILTWRTISCEHAQGPSLRLSPRDRIDLTRLLEVAKSDPDLAGLQPVGWFLSHARSDIFLTAADLEIYNGFFPEPWQVTLVLRPTRSGPARAGFFAREADGALKSESSYQDFTLEPLRLLPPGERPLPSRRDIPGNRQRADQRSGPRLEPAPAKVSEKSPEKAAERPAEKPPEPVVQPPKFLQQPERPKPRSKWLWAIPATLALLIVGVLFKDRLIPSATPTFSFRAYNAGPAIQIEWDPASTPIRGARQATLDIKDGTDTPHFSLSADQLLQGKMTYVPHRGDVQMRMTVSPIAGTPVSEFARLVAPPSAPTPAAAAPAAVPPAVGTPAPKSDAPSEEVVQLRAQRNELESQTKQLREELHKERARADKLQEMVRILQNRLDIDSARTKQQ